MKFIAIVLIVACFSCTQAQDWSAIPIPKNVIQTLFLTFQMAPKNIPVSLIQTQIADPSERLYKALDALSPGYGDQFEAVPGFHMSVHTELLQQRLKNVVKSGNTCILNVFAAVYGSIRIPRTGYLKKISLMILYKILYILADSDDLPGLQAKIPEMIGTIDAYNYPPYPAEIQLALAFRRIPGGSKMVQGINDNLDGETLLQAFSGGAEFGMEAKQYIDRNSGSKS